MPSFKFNKIKTFGMDLFKNFIEDEVPGLAAQMSYFFLLSLFPLLIFLVTLVGYLPFDHQSLLETMSGLVPADSMALIESNLEQVVDSSGGGLLSLGIIGTLWSASNGIKAIMQSLNKAYDVEENRSFIVGRLIAILLLISMLVLIIVALLLPIFGRAIGIYIFSFFGASARFIEVWNMLRWVISSSIFFVVFMYLYRLAPNAKVYLKDVIYGALFATIGWQLVSFGFSFYVNNFGNYSATYGSLGGVIILMFWFYLSGIIIITGGEVNALTARYRGRVNKKDKSRFYKVKNTDEKKQELTTKQGASHHALMVRKDRHLLKQKSKKIKKK